jgi:3-deoxy-manno-octulosonate cytidylyltransferase (CMP-KDO synthetase)
VLKELVELSPSQREVENRLEQLRWLDNNYAIKVAITTYDTVGIDTQEDLDKFQ